MKRMFVIITALVFCAVNASAQDVITKKDGEDIKANVLEIDNNNVKYKLFEEPDGAVYTMPKSQILMIRHESGRSEVFNTSSNPTTAYGIGDREPLDGIRPGMKYSELKHMYRYSDWVSGLGDKHNPALMGVCSWLIPGLGQMISGEVGRGFGWLGGAVGCYILLGVGSGVSAVAVVNENSGQAITGSVISLAGTLALLTVDICAIVDACRVAKVRNLYEQDMRKLNYSIELHPSVDYIRKANGVQPTAGLTLAMKF